MGLSCSFDYTLCAITLTYNLSHSWQLLDDKVNRRRCLSRALIACFAEVASTTKNADAQHRDTPR
jgi:hypothetical protein